ncbi:hemolysin-iii channel protein [Phlyctema vagabunda]|uniref:Hemolysin-iii channel protein n=1 Tax=Phlyctema vagabunda TaxID=108571 RepID=A0ABR4PEH9_9HELO
MDYDSGLEAASIMASSVAPTDVFAGSPYNLDDKTSLSSLSNELDMSSSHRQRNGSATTATMTTTIRVEVDTPFLEKDHAHIYARKPPARDRKPQLLNWDSIPAWHQDNDFILRGYRPISYSWQECVRSWTYMHNESLNIYTHLVPALLFVGAQSSLQTYLSASYPLASTLDRCIFAFFFATAAVCLGLSAAFHTLLNHSQPVSALMLRLDFVGILVLILGKFVSGIYVGFLCEPALKRAYWLMIVTLGSASITVLLSPKYQGSRYRTFRLCTFVATAMSGFIPIMHGVARFGWAQSWIQSGMKYYLLEGLILAVGAIFYSLKAPECYKPGRFDMVGASHQIFHVLVVVAALVHFWGILDAFDYGYHHRFCRVAL